MSTISKIRVFVPANEDTRPGHADHRFPRIRIIAITRHFMDHITMSETIKMVDAEWPKSDDKPREDYLWYTAGHGVGIVLTFITDDAGLGRLTRAIHRHPQFEYKILEIEELCERGAFASRGGA